MSLASLHPVVVHFVIALLLAGVLFRWVSLVAPWPFTGPAALVLLLAGTAAAVLAVESGDAAHGVVERIPGVRAAVEDHQEWGEWTRDIFLGVAALEVLALALGRTRHARYRRPLTVVSAVLGLAGAFAVYETGDKGGDLVYDYAGGVGIRSGDPADVGHLLVAGFYQQAMLDRAQGRGEDASALIGQLAQRYPEDTSVQLLRIESLIVDKKDGKAALAALAPFSTPPRARFLRFRLGLLRADAYAAAGRPDSARLLLQGLAQEFGSNRALEQRMAQLK